VIPKLQDLQEAHTWRGIYRGIFRSEYSNSVIYDGDIQWEWYWFVAVRSRTAMTYTKERCIALTHLQIQLVTSLLNKSRIASTHTLQKQVQKWPIWLKEFSESIVNGWYMRLQLQIKKTWNAGKDCYKYYTTCCYLYGVSAYVVTFVSI
jgi:hypothetical protein